MGNSESTVSSPVIATTDPYTVTRRIDSGAAIRRESGIVMTAQGLTKSGKQPQKPRAKVLGGITDVTAGQVQLYKPGWEAYLDENGHAYYFNALLQETRWDVFEGTHPEDKLVRKTNKINFIFTHFFSSYV